MRENSREDYLAALNSMGIHKHVVDVNEDGTCSLSLFGEEVEDIKFLSTWPVVDLCLRDTSVRDLSPLQDLSLRSFSLAGTNNVDIAPLKDLPLEVLNLGVAVEDITPLRDLPLRSVYFVPYHVTNGLNILSEKSSLEEIVTENAQGNVAYWTPEQWRELSLEEQQSGSLRREGVLGSSIKGGCQETKNPSVPQNGE